MILQHKSGIVPTVARAHSKVGIAQALRPRRGLHQMYAALIGFSALFALQPAWSQALSVAPATSTQAVTTSPQDGHVTRLMDIVAATALKAGLDALKANETPYAQAVRDALPQGSLDRHIMEWAISLSGLRGVSRHEIETTMRDLPDWPNRKALQRNFERAMWREGASADEVIALFANMPPLTAEGHGMLAQAHRDNGKMQAAQSVLGPFWQSAKLDEWSEEMMLDRYGGILTAQDHLIRMQAMLYAERLSAAGRVAEVAGANELYAAWVSTFRGEKQARKLLDAVPPEQQKLAGFTFVKLLQARKARDWQTAAKLLAARPDAAPDAIDPDRWWSERRLVTRALLDQKQYKLAYQVAASHAVKDGQDLAEAEFHAGWIALRYLKQPKPAQAHFENIIARSSGAQSLSRGHYWLGRALEAQKLDATSAYAKAAHFGTTFYGQVAAAKQNMAALDISEPAASPSDIETFMARESVRAISRLAKVGHAPRARSLYFELAEELENTGEISLLGKMARDSGDHFAALKVGKIAAARGLDVGGLSHPIGAIPEGTKIGESGLALAYAIARQESEFNMTAVSRVGALGLLQLMPDTAAEMAKRSKLPFDQMRLTEDAAYNATLGSEFLSQQIDRFDGSYILTFAGYNAGPSRSKEWVRKYGDPRGKDIEFVVDWIERIPFSETRHYVQRIMENYQVYKARLGGRVDIIRDLTLGRQT